MKRGVWRASNRECLPDGRQAEWGMWNEAYALRSKFLALKTAFNPTGCMGVWAAGRIAAGCVSAAEGDDLG